MIRLVLAAVLVASGGLAAPVPKAAKKNASLDGDWRIESHELNGKASPPPPKDYNLWKVAGDTLQLVREGDTTTEAVYPCKLVSEAKDGGPHTFEYTVNANGYHRRGVCEVDGDTLRVAFGSTADDAGKPPTEVKSTEKVTVYVFKRVDAK